MSQQTFSRINVDVNSLNVSAPGRSSFDLSKSSMQSIPFGKLFPVRCTKLMPNSTVKGSVNPDLTLEKFATPAAGRMRLDTHTFIVAAKRIHNSFKQFIESGQVGHTAQNLPSFKFSTLFNSFFSAFWRGEFMLTSTLDDMLYSGYYNTGYFTDYYPSSAFNPSLVYIAWLRAIVMDIMPPLTDSSQLPDYVKNSADFFQLELTRLTQLLEDWNDDFANKYPNDVASSSLTEEQKKELESKQVYLGDFIYQLARILLGEGSTLDQLGYPILSYFGSVIENLNAVDKAVRADVLANADLAVPGVWDDDALQSYSSAFDSVVWDKILNINNYDSGVKLDDSWDVSLSEMPIRANYAVWFDYFRDWHLDPETSCLNPDDFGTSPIIGSNWFYAFCLVHVRPRNYSRDGFTMVQPDDVYRHVYAPAIASSSSSGDIVLDGGDAFDAQYFGISAGKDGEFHLPFPSSFINLFGTTASYYPTYYHDLQTMRRAEMLKRKLTRDYYNPDTYVGQFIARWGVEPADFAIQCTQYLGGSETMIKGNQVTANMQTQDTVLGQRTLVANAASNDSFVYNMGEHAYLLSYVSIVPLVHYDALNPTLQELSVHDQPIPEYANDNQVMIRSCDLLRDYFASATTGLGYVPRYYGYRMALDDAHGKYLREYRSYTWLRDRKYAGDSMLTKNAINAHVNVPLDCFIGLHVWDTVAYGNIQLPLFVECALPDKLENV